MQTFVETETEQPAILDRQVNKQIHSTAAVRRLFETQPRTWSRKNAENMRDMTHHSVPHSSRMHPDERKTPPVPTQIPQSPKCTPGELVTV
jgi:hypothetical protein